MDEIPLVTSSTIISIENFWTAVLLYHDRPHLVNRKLTTISPILLCKIFVNSQSVTKISDIFTWESLIYEVRKLPDISQINLDFIKSITENYETILEETTWDKLIESFEGVFISLRILFSRKGDKCVEIVIFDKENTTATFFAIHEQTQLNVAPRFRYDLQLTKEGHLRILVKCFEDADTPAAEWLADKLFAKLLKWSDNELSDKKIIKSLNLISVNEYCSLYSQLKPKYTEELLKRWSEKTKTDPQKYIFEDIAIASYLICLWKRTNSQNVNFVDCGCGNGLLVHILNQEGYKGCGYDIRSRKVWELYPKSTDLRVGTIAPNTIFSDATWLIGNHSDELTVWIPIIAFNSNLNTNFFVLPCCPYDLNGSKYIRKNTKVSQYEDFIDYVKIISQICGFETSVDKLRIPSTKRTALIGMRNNFDKENIQALLNNFMEKNLKSKFIARNSVEKVRNCTQLDKGLINKIIALIVAELLTQECYLKPDTKSWNIGGSLSLNYLSKIISEDDRKSLKNECGGLQTLLKNHRYIFSVLQGNVTLQKPLSLKETSKYKDKPCWFESSHPNGCFYNAENCAYKHQTKF